ncbi:MAG: CxxC-x17-CxxC domain-containing protein [Candidatus Omnitrophota bacterium]
MKRIFKRKSSDAGTILQPDISAAIDKIQQQLAFLEEKIDTLIAQPAARPSGSFRHDRGRCDNIRERSFTKAICAECNTECEVPFRPTGDRPVYCKECFSRRQEASGGSGGSFKPRFDRSPKQDRGFAGGRRKPAFRKRSRERA